MALVPRLRFAPSPTGYLHIGSARTVLFNWLVARQTGGEMLLRIEDTDTERNRPELIDNILEILDWLGLGWDGEPVYQSERSHLYAKAADELLAAGRAYWCDCTVEQVQARAKERGGPPGYDGFCRDRGLERGPGTALRFHTPDDGVTRFDDVIRGEVEFPNAALEDFVLVRSNGHPTFLLANLVDDAEMAVTHVVRGEEHVNGTPKYLLIAEALGLAYSPVFAHLPVLVNEQRKKLSKRRDSVSVADFRSEGYLPEALVNYLALLGW
jgi:glutamyl-tRNA synthetase